MGRRRKYAWLLWVALFIYLALLSSASWWLRRNAEIFSADVLFSGLLALFSLLLVLTSWRFQQWTRKTAESRTDPDLVVQGLPRIGKGMNNITLILMCSNPGDTIATVLNIDIINTEIESLGRPIWKWEALYPPLRGRRVPACRADAEESLVDLLPGPIFSGGLTRFFADYRDIPDRRIDILRQQKKIIFRIEFKMGNRPAKPKEYELPLT